MAHSPAGSDTALSFLHRRASAVAIPTGIAAVDVAGIAGAGMTGGESVLITGPHASGKTQLCLHIVVQALLSGRDDARVVFYDCDGGFDARRLHCMLTAAAGAEAASLLERVEVVQPTSLLEISLSLLDLSSTAMPSLVVVDGLGLLAACERGQPAHSVNVPFLLKALCSAMVPVVLTAAPLLSGKAHLGGDSEAFCPQPFLLAKQIAVDFSPAVTLAAHPAASSAGVTQGCLTDAKLHVVNGRVKVTLGSAATSFTLSGNRFSFSQLGPAR